MRRLARWFGATSGRRATNRRFLRAFPGHPFATWLDTLWLARAAWPQLPSHSLGEICRHFGLGESIGALVAGRRWHDALYDAVASLVLLEHIVETFGLATRPLAALLTPDASAWRKARE